jgi:hypothetical protein
MIQNTFIDKDGIVLSIHECETNDYVIHLTDNSVDVPYDVIAYRLDYEDIDEIIKLLKAVKNLIQSENVKAIH